MRIDILTLFPDSMRAVLGESILGRAAKKGILDIHCTQIRDYTENRQMQVDDYPYGGGWGCVMMAQPLKSCLDDVMAQAGPRRSRVLYMSPQGKPFSQEIAKRLVRDYDHLVLVCGHYEGVDERFIEECVDEELSIGDYVLTGGELAAMVVTDCVCRMVPGVLSDAECYTGESHWDGLLEYPQYTRPDVWEGREVPEVLRSGDHAKVARWRRKKQLERTMDKRPDLFEKLELTDKTDRQLLEEIRRERSRMVLTEPVGFRLAVPEDLPTILALVDGARKRLKKARVNVWQGSYPGAEGFEEDIRQGACYVLLYGETAAGVFTVTAPGEPYYDAELTDGRWHGAEYAVLHRNLVDAKYAGTGMADREMEFVEQVAREKGARSIRLLTHKKNLPMKRLLAKHGYRYCGNVELRPEPGLSGSRQAFEKVLE